MSESWFLMGNEYITNTTNNELEERRKRAFGDDQRGSPFHI